MQYVLWKGCVQDGKMDDYIRKHDEIWPALIALMRKAGMRNYSIFRYGQEIVGYYECADMEKRAQVYTQNAVLLEKWNAHMDGIMQMQMDSTGNPLPYEQVFYME